jgi:hypothetical protein
MPGITLTATGYRVQGRHTVGLSWSVATSSSIDLYRDGVVIATAPNTGAYTNSIDVSVGATCVTGIRCARRAQRTAPMR